MGFRSVFITSDDNVHWPNWFVEKYSNSVYFNERGVGCISSKFESKATYSIVEDIQAALGSQNFPFYITFLHECGGITKVNFVDGNVIYCTPEDWHHDGGFMHSYCYGCSDAYREEVTNVSKIMDDLAQALQFSIDYPAKPNRFLPALNEYLNWRDQAEVPKSTVDMDEK